MRSKIILLTAVIISATVFVMILLRSQHPGLQSNQIFKPTEGEEEGEEHDKLREKWQQLMHRAAPGTDWEKIEAANHKKLLAEKNRLRKLYATSKTTSESYANGKIIGGWSERGSTNQAGSSIAIDYSADSNMLYTITAGGSLWKSSLAGNNWKLLNDDIIFSNRMIRIFNKATGGQRIMAVDNNTQNVIYSDDDGKTFLYANGTTSSSFYISEVTNMIIFGAQQIVYFSVKGYNSDNGKNEMWLYYSTDNGANFQKIYTFADDRADIARPSRTSSVYILDPFSQPGKFILSSLSGITVTQLNAVNVSTTVSNTCNLKGTYTGTTTTLYALTDNGNIFRSTDLGASWTFKGATPTESWDRLDVAQNNPDHIFIGAVNAYRSYDQGSTWTQVNDWSDYYGDVQHKLHADIMDIRQFRKKDNSVFTVITSHGGVAVSYDDLLTTTNLSLTGLNNAQYYSVVTNTDVPSQIFGGTQDQGWQRSLNGGGTGVLNFDQIISGDYGYMTLSGTPKHLWAEYPGGWILHYNDPTSNSYSSYTMDGSAKSNYGWMLPTANVSSSTENSVLMGGGNINGGSGSYLAKLTASNSSPYNITATQYNYDFRANSNQGWGGVTAIEASRIDSNRMYVAAEDGTFFYSPNNGTSWFKSNFNGPGPWYLYGSAIYSSRLTNGLIWYGGSGYSNPAVYQSTDGGQTFSAMNNGLPNTLVHCLTANSDESLLFAGTDAGPYVYVREDNEWYSLTGVNTPLQIFTSVQYIASQNLVRFSTFGRGIWDFKITCFASKPTITASGSVTNVCPGKTITLTSFAANSYLWNTGETTQSIVVSNGGNYFVTVTSGGGCTTTSDIVTVSYQNCGAPTGLAVRNLSSTSAKIKWKAVDCALEYQYQYRQKGTTAWTTKIITKTSQNLTGLAPLATYQWRVRTRCQVDPKLITSAYKMGPEFTTIVGFANADKEEASQNSLQFDAFVYPNPATDMARVTLKNAGKDVQVVLTDLAGKILWKRDKITEASLEIPVAGLSSGSYMVIIKDAVHSKTLKLIKQ